MVSTPAQRHRREDDEFLCWIEVSRATHTVARSTTVLENIPAERVTAQSLGRNGFRDGVVVEKTSSDSTTSRVFKNSLLKIGEICFGFNRLLWSIANSQRYYRAIDDLSMGWGLILGSVGATIKVYGI